MQSYGVLDLLGSEDSLGELIDDGQRV